MANSTVKELEDLIVHLDTLYEAGEECRHPITNEIITDNEYDAFKQDLYKIHPESDIFKTPTSSKFEQECQMVKHSPPMTSISKCNGSQEEKETILRKWMVSHLRQMGKISPTENPTLEEISMKYNDHFSMSLKHDGVALSLYYQRGKLEAAALRHGDGTKGFDVTEQVKYIDNIPQAFKIPWNICIRGELECKKSVFEQINDEIEQQGGKTYANPRNFTAGSIHQFKNPEMVKERRLSFTPYSILNIYDPRYTTETECAIWARKNIGIDFVECHNFSIGLLKEWEKNHRHLDFMVDGVVISVNDMKWQKKMGNHGDSPTGNPKYKIAWKFADEAKQVEIKDIVWRTGRTGNITPVIFFDGVEIEHTIVSKCTAHNLGIIKKHQMGIGSKVEIIKSGKIIPKIKSVLTPGKNCTFPQECPSCHNPTKIIKGGENTETLYCDNESCPAKNIRQLTYFLARMGVKGIGEKLVEKLTDNSLVSSFSDFYKLNTEDIMLGTSLPLRSSLLMIARIHGVPAPEKEKDNNILSQSIKKYKSEKKQVPLSTLLAAIGIEGIGTSLGQSLSIKYQTIENIMKATQEELENIEGVGSILAKNIYEYLQKFASEIENILQYIEIEKRDTTNKKLDGKIFVLTGGFPEGKKTWQDKIMQEGGIIKTSVSKSVDYVIVGTDAGSKLKKAQDLNIPCINLDQLKTMV